MDSTQSRAVRKAIAALGYIKASAETALIAMLQDIPVEHPKKICTAYRKEGEQLSRDEKQALGLRANAFMSRKAFDDLTDHGRDKPLEARTLHYCTRRSPMVATVCPKPYANKHKSSSGASDSCMTY
ncbi:MAG: hypothetical protein QM741_06895 [Rudaea sp.]|uniref:hypothetical protein n=1 Tax=Rudaea sp. TaxID=2136325 RepID=UPI0039E66B88